MIVELRGVGTINKGAHLMLKAICEEFRKRGRDDLLVSPVTFGFSGKAIKAEGLTVRLSGKKYRLEYARLLQLFPRKLRLKWKLILPDDVDVILDASGFLYGDQWPVQNIKIRMGNDIGKLAENNVKIILLPQAFGPFERKEIREEVRRIISHCSLIFARDQVSFDHLIASFGKLPAIERAPDFTNLVSVGAAEKSTSKPRIAIIPNVKIVAHKKDHAKRYYSMLANTARILSPSYNVFFLIHEGDDDFRIANAVNDIAGTKFDIVRKDNPVDIKKEIKECYGIITGRFHGLVSALSQGIPALGTSWSHKYVELLKDYDYEEGLLSIDDDNDYLKHKLRIFEDKELYQQVKDRIIENADQEKQKTREMWDKVFDVIL